MSPFFFEQGCPEKNSFLIFYTCYTIFKKDKLLSANDISRFCRAKNLTNIDESFDQYSIVYHYLREAGRIKDYLKFSTFLINNFFPMSK